MSWTGLRYISFRADIWACCPSPWSASGLSSPPPWPCWERSCAQPNFPANEFDVLKRQSRAELSKASNEPALLASRTLQRTLNPYPADDVRYIPTLEEAIERLDRVSLADVRQLYTTQVGASVGEVVVVGDVDPETTPSLLAGFLKDWKSGTPYRRIAPTAQTDIAGRQLVLQTPDRANAVYMAAESLVLEDTDPDYAALLLGNYLFGGSPLALRLSMRVRGKEGLSYAVGSQFSADALDRVGRFAVFAITNPKNIDKVNQAVAEELKKMSARGVSPDELDEGRKAYLQQLEGDALHRQPACRSAVERVALRTHLRLLCGPRREDKNPDGRPGERGFPQVGRPRKAGDRGSRRLCQEVTGDPIGNHLKTFLDYPSRRRRSRLRTSIKGSIADKNFNCICFFENGLLNNHIKPRWPELPDPLWRRSLHLKMAQPEDRIFLL